jgi:hypothetical protein
MDCLPWLGIRQYAHSSTPALLVCSASNRDKCRGPVLKKISLPPVPPLGHVVRKAGNHHAGKPRHLGKLPQRTEKGVRYHVDASRQDLIYAARVRAGFVPATRRDVFERLKRLRALTCPFRQPSRISMRFGTSHDGMPIGVQIVGNWQAESTILHVASLLERVSPVRDLHPKL